MCYLVENYLSKTMEDFRGLEYRIRLSADDDLDPGTFVQCSRLGQLEILHEHLLAVDNAGFITHFEPSESLNSSTLLRSTDVPVIELNAGEFILPTFCDLHLHAPQFLYQGNGLHLPLMEWLNEYAFKAEEKLDANPDLARKVYTRLASRLVDAGVGAVLLFGTIRMETNLILAEVMQAAGIRGFVGKLSMDVSSRPSYIEASSEVSIKAAKTFSENVRTSVAHLPPHRRLVEPVITPRFVPTCSDELLRGLGELSESKQLKIQSHLAEAKDQVEWVRKERGAEDLHIFDRHNLLTPRTIQAHCTFLDSSSLGHLHVRGTAVAHCPLSNAYFSSEPFRLRESLIEGVKVGLGTDIAGGYSLDIMNTMRQAVIISRMREGSRDENAEAASQGLAIDWKESLFLATRGGAQALELASGEFRIGVPFDAQHIRIFDPATGLGVGAMDFFELEAEPKEPALLSLSEQMVEKWWCIGDERNRTGMWVQGVQPLTAAAAEINRQISGP